MCKQNVQSKSEGGRLCKKSKGSLVRTEGLTRQVPSITLSRAGGSEEGVVPGTEDNLLRGEGVLYLKRSVADCRGCRARGGRGGGGGKGCCTWN